MSDVKRASPDHPIREELAARWSPYSWDDRPVSEEDLRSVFEGARWAASAFNEQPWRYVVATKGRPEEYEKLLSCLVEGNREWAKFVPVLALGVIRKSFARNEKPNRVALHDLGQASANLAIEATSRGLHVHQMGGILPDRAREVYGIPERFEAITGLAIGYAGESPGTPEELKERDRKGRSRRPLAEFVFGGEWEKPAAIL